MDIKVKAEPDGDVDAYFTHYSKWLGIGIPPNFELITDWSDGEAVLDLDPGEYVFSILVEGPGSSLEFDCTEVATGRKPRITTPRDGKWAFTFKVPKKELRRLFHVYCVVGDAP